MRRTGDLGEKASVALATVEPFPALATVEPFPALATVEPFPALAEPEPSPPPISTRAIIARRKRGSGLAFLVRMAIVVALGGVLANWIWQQIGAPRIELHKNVDGSVKEIKVVPTR